VLSPDLKTKKSPALFFFGRGNDTLTLVSFHQETMFLLDAVSGQQSAKKLNEVSTLS
jgi:hypothetical protein